MKPNMISKADCIFLYTLYNTCGIYNFRYIKSLSEFIYQNDNHIFQQCLDVVELLSIRRTSEY